MGNNEDSASFITTCSSIPDLTTRVALPRGWAGGSTLGLHLRLTSCAQKGWIQRSRRRVCLALEPLHVTTRLHHPPPPPLPSAPYFQSVSRRLPRKRSWLGSVIASRASRETRYSEESYRVQIVVRMRWHVCDLYIDKYLSLARAESSAWPISLAFKSVGSIADFQSFKNLCEATLKISLYDIHLNLLRDKWLVRFYEIISKCCIERKAF